ncbi:hypothetical protein ACOXXX_07245 [Thalassococcus sp. BH17M4-6]|uniref:hypothetical protein n=1 Tax=Thalassococcus sp. BH17M4-6 TaxID=3413148 RepID=UPI003BBD3407
MHIATRAAARVLPAYWKWVLTSDKARRRNLTALPILRSLLTAAVAGRASTAAVRSASAASAAAASSAAAADVAAAADDAAYADAAYAAAYAADAAARAAPAADVWQSVRGDAKGLEDGRDVFAEPLWPDACPFATDWQEIKDGVGPDWDFWVAWYDRMLDPNGQPPNWEMLERIALIDNEVWKGPVPEALAAINGIWAEYLLSDLQGKTPFAWRVYVTSGQKLATEPKEKLDLLQVVQDTRRALREHVARCKADRGKSDIGTAVLDAFARTIERLRKDLSKFKNNPADLHRVIEEARGDLALISQNEGFTKEPLAARLIGNLSVRAQDVCVAAPSVLEMVKERQRVEYHLLSAEQVSLARKIAAGLEHDSTGPFKAACAVAFAVLGDVNRPEEEKAAAWSYIKAASVHSAVAALEFEASEAKSDGSTKKPSVMERMASWGRKMSDIDRGVDALQEVGAEAGEWLPEVLETLTRSGA